MKIELRGVGKSFGDHDVLQEIDCSFGPGELIAIVGTNGAGKTTLLKLLSTLLAPDYGDIWMDGQRLTHRRIDLRRELHFLDEQPLLLGSVVDHICRVLHLYHRDVANLTTKIVQWLKEFGLLTVAHGRALSRGQKYKTAFVGLCAANPGLWLLDEPFAAGVDPPGISAMKRAINKAVGSGSTITYTTQIVELAESFSDRVLVLDGGKLAVDIATRQMLEAGCDNTLARLFESLRLTTCK